MENSEYSNALSIGRTYSFKIRAQKYERKNVSAKCGNHLMDPFNFPLNEKVV